MATWLMRKKSSQVYKSPLIRGTLLLVVVHTVGVIGFWSAYKQYFIMLTPLNLVLSAFVLVNAHRDFKPGFWLFCAVCFLVGFVVELVGTQTGLLFGHYYYGNTLGWKIGNTPVIMGVNWLILVYSSGVVIHKFKLPVWAKSTLAALIMVALDYLIEPVAMRYDFWHWQGGIIPLQNYLMWFVIAFGLLVFFYRLNFEKENPLAIVLLGVQFAFFGALSIP